MRDKTQRRIIVLSACDSSTEPAAAAKQLRASVRVAHDFADAVAALEEKRRLSRRKTGEFLAELGSDDAHELVRLVHRMNEIIEKNRGARLREILYSENPKPENGFCDTPTTNK